MPAHDQRPVLYVVACGGPPAADVPEFVSRMLDEGWCVCVLATPSALRWLDTARLEELTGYPVRSGIPAARGGIRLPARRRRARGSSHLQHGQQVGCRDQRHVCPGRSTGGAGVGSGDHRRAVGERGAGKPPAIPAESGRAAFLGSAHHPRRRQYAQAGHGPQQCQGLPLGRPAGGAVPTPRPTVISGIAAATCGEVAGREVSPPRT